MGIKVKAVESNVSFNKEKEHWMYVMKPALYSQLAVSKVIEQAALTSGLQKGVLEAALAAYGNVVKTWATEGHSIPIPGLGTMRFGLRSIAVDDVSKVSASLITSRRVIFMPSVDIKKALEDTSVSITCYDRYGEVVKTVDSKDKDDVEEPDNDTEDKGETPGTGGAGSDTNAGASGSEDKGDNAGGNTDAGGSGTGGSDGSDVGL